MIALAALVPLLLPQVHEAASDRVGDVPYRRLETRAQTEQAMLAALLPTGAQWGDWWALSPFPYAGHDQNDLATPYGPEHQMERLRAGGPGVDLEATFVGKNETDAHWRRLGDISGRRIELHFFEEPELSDQASCYLYAQVQSDAARTVEVDCGSDDGMRLWLNGELLVDRDVPRGLDPLAEHVTLRLASGVNHVLVKVAEGAGDWAFQIAYRERLDTRSEAQLDYLLNRDFPPGEERLHYRVLTVPVPDEVVLEVGGLDFFADGSPVVCTRRGDVYRVRDAYAEPPLDARFERFASGLHEPLGLAVRQEAEGEAVYCVQRPELTRLVDEDGDGRADLYECYSDGWGVSGNYHEFAFGPTFDAAGNAWVTLNVGFCGSLGKSVARWRGWALKITPEREVLPVASGLRSPNGIGAWTDGAMFYVDNQGDYVGTNRMSLLDQGSWHGHPASLRWDAEHDAAEPPARQPASVWFPYRKMGQSTADIALDQSGGAFGPFGGQLFVGDQTASSVMRVFLETVEGHHQGACFPFLGGLQCGVNRVAFAPDGSLFVGQTDRGWGSTGGRPYGLQRIVHTGLTPFEVLEMRATEDGFELEFTEELDPGGALDPTNYRVSSYTYEYHAAYGAPESDTRELPVREVRAVDARTVRLVLEGLRAGYVHELSIDGVRSSGGRALLHGLAYYTLERIPGRAPMEEAQEQPRVLLVTQSAGFVHEVVKRAEPEILSLAELRLVEAARGRFRVRATQDASELTPETLAEYDAVVFYTSGELPLPEGNRGALLDWVHAGGAFVGVHSATDTLYELPLYQRMLGGVFSGHPWHQEVRIHVEDRAHPASRHLPEVLTIEDEIYQFQGFRRYPSRVLLSLDPSSVDLARGAREDGDYALAWAREWGRGRVFYSALGHGAELWSNPDFLEHLLGGIAWTIEGPDLPLPAPPEATVLLDGRGLDAWRRRGTDEPATWKLVSNGALRVGAGEGDLVSAHEHGDAHVHLEFRVPHMPEASGQERGNSGVYLQGRYEVQILDSFDLPTSPEDCAAIYGQRAPDQNSCRVPGRWQTYDIDFTAARFDASGRKKSNARMSVWHNGRRVHNRVELTGPTAGGLGGEVALGPLLLQDHGTPVEYRNIWVSSN